MLKEIKGQYFEVSNPDDPYWKWIKDGCYDHEWLVYDTYLKPAHTFIDLGAWIGAHSMYASRVAKTVVAVEPDPVAFAILAKNLYLLDPRPETVILRDAIAEKESTIVLGSGWLGASTTRRNLAAGNNIGTADPKQTFETQTKTLRDLISLYPDPLFIKMDIEGMEEEVFKDWKLFHERKPTLLVEFHPWWWVNEAEARKNFGLLGQAYKTVLEVRPGYYLLEP